MIPSGAPTIGAVLVRCALLLNIAGFAAIAIVANLCVFGFGWQGFDSDADADWLNLPGWVMGAVWIGLFCMLGVARWSVSGAQSNAARRWIDGLALLCFAFPFYALTTDSHLLGLLGILLTGAVAVAAVRRARSVSARAAALIAPVPVWLCFASLMIILD